MPFGGCSGLGSGQMGDLGSLVMSFGLGVRPGLRTAYVGGLVMDTGILQYPSKCCRAQQSWIVPTGRDSGAETSHLS